MSQKTLFITLLLLGHATQSPPATRANCPEPVLLVCPGVDLDTMNFLSVSWYKLHGKKRQGIIWRGKGGTEKKSFNFSRPASFGEKYGLLLPSVTDEDSGTYECTVSANIGEKNINVLINLIVNACATQADLVTQQTTTNLTNTSNLDQLHHTPADLPVTWSVIAYLALGLAKIILSLISIRVMQAVYKRSGRQRHW